MGSADSLSAGLDPTCGLENALLSLRQGKACSRLCPAASAGRNPPRAAWVWLLVRQQPVHSESTGCVYQLQISAGVGNARTPNSKSSLVSNSKLEIEQQNSKLEIEPAS